MSTSSNSFSAGYSGCKVISNTSANTGSFRGFIVNDDAVKGALIAIYGESNIQIVG